MSRRRAITVGAGSLLGATSPALALGAPRNDAQPLFLNGVTIVDTHDGALTRNVTIVIAGGKIGKIAAAGSVPSDRSARTIDARGLFAVPGFNDLHAHPIGTGDPEGTFALMLAHGITGFRQMSGSPKLLESRRAGTLMPPDAPELLEMPGLTLAGPNARSTEAVVAEIQQQKAQGADFIKFIDMRPDVFFAAAAECARQGLRFMGHLPPSVNVRDAASAGMRSIEHMGPRDSILLGCSTDEAALRQAMAAAPLKPPPPPPSAPPTDADIRRAVANPTVSTDPSEFVRYQRVIDTFSDARARDLAARFVAAGTWLNPTLIRVRTMEFGDDPLYWNDPNLRYVPRGTRQMWEGVSGDFTTRLSAQSRATLKQLFTQQLGVVKPFKAAGVKMLAGSDLGGGFVIPGFSLHQEFDLLETAGLGPLDVLQMTTLNGAQFLGREATMGSVAEGKDANLVLLNANPIVSIQNLHAISAVVRAGVYYDARALEDMKRRTERRVASGAAVAMNELLLCC